jgi:hypothetical protein
MAATLLIFENISCLRNTRYYNCVICVSVSCFTWLCFRCTKSHFVSRLIAEIVTGSICMNLDNGSTRLTCDQNKNNNFDCVHSGPSHLSLLKVGSIQCNSIFLFIMPLHVSIYYDHHQRIIFPISIQSGDYWLYIMLFTLFYIQHVIIIFTRAKIPLLI